jgi:hypothetical protein
MWIRDPAQVAEAEAKLASILERLAQKVIPNLEVRASGDGRRTRVTFQKQREKELVRYFTVHIVDCKAEPPPPPTRSANTALVAVLRIWIWILDLGGKKLPNKI